MVFYDYLCKKCDKIVEVRKSIKDDTDELCPECGEKMERQISKTSFVLKNGKSGWAKNGYSDVKP